MASRQLIAVIFFAMVAMRAYGQPTPPATLMDVSASNSYLTGSFTPIRFEDTRNYIRSKDIIDRAAVVGHVPWAVFYNWVVSLENCSSPSVGYVSWQDAFLPMERSTQVLAYQWQRNAANDASAPLDCSARMDVMTMSAANIPYLPGAIQTPYGVYPQAQSGYRFTVESADYKDNNGDCQMIVRYPDDVVEVAKQIAQSMNHTSSSPDINGRKLLATAAGVAGCVGAAVGTAGAAVGAGVACVASLGIACAGAVAGAVGAGLAVPAACQGCFPGSATVMTPQGLLQMNQLAIGDLVLTSKGYEKVFLFGERETDKVASMVSIQTSSEVIRMTRDHFIPTACAGNNKQECYKRAETIQPGDAIWVQNSTGKQLQTVVKVDSVVDVGLFNPYTPSGTIVVNNVVASVHSQWFLDDVCDKLGCVGWLPSIYQVAMIPIRAVCAFVELFGGPGAVNAVDNFFGLTYLGHNFPKSFMATLLAAPAMSALFLLHGSATKA